MSDSVPLEPFRKAFNESGLTAGEVAARMGYWHTGRDKCGDTTRVYRLLNMRPQSKTIKHGKRYGGTMKHNDTIQYEVGVRLAEALGVDPIDLGI